MTERTAVVPVNDPGRYVERERSRLLAAVTGVLDSGRFVMAEQHDRFEREFSAYVGAAHAVAVGNGTDALSLALLAVGVRPADDVITVANAGGYASSAILAIGAVPRYVDIDAADMQMSAAALSAALSAAPAAAVVLTHLYGNRAPADAVSTVCAAAAVPLVEDCAQAAGLTDERGRHVGTWGAAGTFSFYPTKNLAALGDGGAVVTSDEAVADRLRKLRQYGWSAKYTIGMTGGRNSRLDEVQAAVLLLRLPDVQARNDRRRQVAARYTASMSVRAGRMVTDPHGVAHLAVAAVPDRAAFRKSLLAAGIATDVHYPVADHLQPAWRRSPRADGLPVTESACAQVVTLPCFPDMTAAETDAVCEAISAIG